MWTTDGDLSRRRFVVGSMSLPAAALVLGNPRAAEARRSTVPARASADPSLRTWRSVRAQFRLDPKLVNFASFILASHPAPVRRLIAEHRDSLDADPSTYVNDNEFARDQESAAAAASYLGADPELVALTDSTTMGLALVYRTLALRKGTEVLTSEHDHYSTHEPLRYRAHADGVRVRKVRLYPPNAPELATPGGVVDALMQGIGPRTRVIAITWVHSSSGCRLPVRAIADALKVVNARRRPDRRILLVVDGVHGLGVTPLEVEKLGCDVFVAGCHKWLWGPRGTGLVWATPAAWERMRPVIPSFDPRLYGAWIQGRVGTAPPGPTMTPGGFHSFEHRWALPAAFGFHEAIGPERIARRIRVLSRRLRSGIAALPGVDLRSPGGSLASGVVCCEVRGKAASSVVGELRSRHRVAATVTPYAVPLVRFGTTCLNTPSEVDELLHALAAVRG